MCRLRLNQVCMCLYWSGLYTNIEIAPVWLVMMRQSSKYGVTPPKFVTKYWMSIFLFQIWRQTIPKVKVKNIMKSQTLLINQITPCNMSPHIWPLRLVRRSTSIPCITKWSLLIDWYGMTHNFWGVKKQNGGQSGVKMCGPLFESN